MTTELLFSFSDIEKKIDTWNEQLNNFFTTYLGNPIVGYLIFFGILAVAAVFITKYHNK